MGYDLILQLWGYTGACCYLTGCGERTVRGGARDLERRKDIASQQATEGSITVCRTVTCGFIGGGWFGELLSDTAIPSPSWHITRLIFHVNFA